MGSALYARGCLRDSFSGVPIPPPWEPGSLHKKPVRVKQIDNDPEQIEPILEVPKQSEELPQSKPPSKERLAQILRGMD